MLGKSKAATLHRRPLCDLWLCGLMISSFLSVLLGSDSRTQLVMPSDSLHSSQEQIHIASPISNKCGWFFFFFFFFWEGGIHLFLPQKDRIAGNNTQFPNKTWNSATCSLNFDPVFFPPQSKHSNLNYLASTRYMSFSLSIKLSQVNSNLWINVTSFLIKIVQHYIMLYKSLILN